MFHTVRLDYKVCLLRVTDDYARRFGKNQHSTVAATSALKDLPSVGFGKANIPTSLQSLRPMFTCKLKNFAVFHGSMS
jgi:hypothetical protein